MSFGYTLVVIVSMDGTLPMATGREAIIITDSKNKICKSRKAASVGGLIVFWGSACAALSSS